MSKQTYGASDILKEAFYKGLKHRHEEGSKEWKAAAKPEWNTFRISEMGECAALLTRKWKANNEVSFSPAAMYRMYDGTVTHGVVRDFLRIAKITILKEEQEVKGQFKAANGVTVKLIGHLDNIVQVGKEKWIIDIKKAGESSFSTMGVNGLSDTYHDQLYGYMACTGIKQAMVFMVGTHGEQQTFELKWSQKQFKHIIDRLGVIALHRKNKTVGEREYDYGVPPCSWCPFATDCWKPADIKDSEDTVYLKPKFKQKLAELVEVAKKRREWERLVTEAKSQERELAIGLLDSHGASKTLVDKDGGNNVSWTTFKKSVFKFDEKNIPMAIKKGWGRFETSEVNYPRISGLKED